MVIPTDNMIITQDTVFSPGIYSLPNGIQIIGNGITLEGNETVLIGINRKGKGVYLSGCENITIKNLTIMDYYHGIAAQNCNKLAVIDCSINATGELPANSFFLDIWLQAQNAYGGGILLDNVCDSVVRDNDLSHQMNGLLTYHCKRIKVINNLANYCSGWGYHLFDTSECLYENNVADFCCRYEPRGERKGHMGADSAGFLIVYHSCNNIFRSNQARMGGDGFFLAGMTPKFQYVGCNDNLFEDNDGSFSPNNAFEATFSSGNIFRNNYANNSNYGFWLGFSKDAVLDGNQIIGNRQAGIATENGFNIKVQKNQFINNQHGILLWLKHIPDFALGVPDNITSYKWTIEENIFSNNHKAIRIAANQDHGILPLQESGELGLPTRQPYEHIIRNNRFMENVQNVEQINTQDNLIENNEFLKTCT